jgi:hypothetical protein
VAAVTSSRNEKSLSTCGGHKRTYFDPYERKKPFEMYLRSFAMTTIKYLYIKRLKNGPKHLKQNV